jgi:hypothetical protein
MGDKGYKTGLGFMICRKAAQQSYTCQAGLPLFGVRHFQALSPFGKKAKWGKGDRANPPAPTEFLKRPPYRKGDFVVKGEKGRGKHRLTRMDAESGPNNEIDGGRVEE